MKIISHCASEGKPVISSQVFNRATNGAICFRASKRTWAHLKELALRWVRNPLFPLWVPNIFHKHIWYFPWSRQDEIADGSTWPEAWFLLVIWVEVQDKEQHLAELTVSEGEGHTPALSQQESVTTFRHSPRQETALDGTRSWKVKSKQSAISDFAKLGQDFRACYFLR